MFILNFFDTLSHLLHFTILSLFFFFLITLHNPFFLFFFIVAQVISMFLTFHAKLSIFSHSNFIYFSMLITTHACSFLHYYCMSSKQFLHSNQILLCLAFFIFCIFKMSQYAFNKLHYQVFSHGPWFGCY